MKQILCAIPLVVATLFGTVAMAESLPEAELALPVLDDANAADSQGVFFGIFREMTAPELVAEAPGDLRRKPAAVLSFSRFGGAFPQTQVLYLHQQGYVPQITWEPWGPHDEPMPLADFVNGKWDAYITQYAKDAARLDLPFMLRWGHEFNSDWYPWSLIKNGRDPQLYVQAFRRIVDIFRREGANKVQFVWCFNNDSVPNESWNSPVSAYPGDEYVDWIGIDGYNWGTSKSWSSWRSFEQVVKTAYDMAQKIAPSKPILIAEIASAETGGDKAAWIKGMFTALPNMPAIRGVSWFDLRKETAWNIDSSSGAWAAMIQGLRQPWVRGNAEAMYKVAGRKAVPREK